MLASSHLRNIFLITSLCTLSGRSCVLDKNLKFKFLKGRDNNCCVSLHEVLAYKEICNLHEVNKGEQNTGNPWLTSNATITIIVSLTVDPFEIIKGYICSQLSQGTFCGSDFSDNQPIEMWSE